ncbi:MAG: CRISPR-associated endoribonuclease Cas6 [Salinibacter sp.]
MRIRIELRSEAVPQRLPLNANYHLTSLIYRLLERSSRDFSEFLHDEGFRSGTKRFKLFTYSQLRADNYRIEPPWLVALEPRLVWEISSPVNAFVEHLADGLLREGRVRLYDETFSAELLIERVETVVPPEFTERMTFVCRSPLVASRPVERNGRLIAHYYRHDEDGLSDAIRDNLVRKHRVLHGSAPSSVELMLRFDPGYCHRRRGKVDKLIDFKGTKIKGILAPFSVEGNPELIEVGYEAGFGEKNSMGFGMVTVIAPRARGDADEC